MKSILFLSLMLSYLLQVSAQGSQSSVTSQSSVASQNSVTAAPSPTTTAFTLTPQESASSLASYYSALATSAPIQPGSGPLPGDAGSSAGSSQSASEAGASGSDSGSFTLSKAGIIAIAVVVSCVVIFGIATSVLWYMAKKRDWEVRQKIRSSAKRIAATLTPRRSTFPKDVRSGNGLVKFDEIPPTPRRDFDMEKGNVKMMPFELSEPPLNSKWAR